jgi:peptidoglycan/LPS O-acetylase OafA/YrhL
MQLPPLQSATDELILPADPSTPFKEVTRPIADKEHMLALDGLRGFAAVIVLISHLHIAGSDWQTENLGRCGVLLFFALSGFLMAHLHLKKPFNADSARRFCAARVARIVPLYYTVVILAYLATHVLGMDTFRTYTMDSVQLLRQLAFVGSVSVFWSVGPEFQFYGFFVLLWAITLLHGTPRTIALAALGVFAIACFVASPRLPGILFLSKLQIFLAGIAVALLRWWLAAQHQPTSVARNILQILACVATYVLLMPSSQMLLPLFPQAAVADYSRWYYADLPRVLLAGLVVLAFSYGTRLSDQLLGNRLMRELGRASFSIYLLHEPVIAVMQATGVFNQLNPLVVVALCLAVTVLVASAVNRVFETPARIWVTRKLSPPRPVGATTMPTS